MASISGGKALQRRLDEIASKLGQGGEVNVGFLEGATYPSGPVRNQAGKMVQTSAVSVATVAAAQNWGTDTIPKRPFFTNMVRDKGPTWGKAVAAQLKAADYDLGRALDRVGQGIKGQLQQSIVDTNDPPLKPETVARKGFAKPLIDTSIMLNSVDYEVDVE